MAGSDHDAAVQNSVIIPFVAISTIFITLRCYVGLFMTKVTGFDDLFATLAWVSLVGQSFVELHEFSGQARQGVNSGISQLPTSNLLYIVTTGLLRLAVVTFLTRLNKHQTFRSLIWTVGFLTAIQTSTCFFIYLLVCKDVKDLWNPANQQRQCLNVQREAYIFWAQSASGVAIDVALLMMATWATFFHKRNSAWNFKAIFVLLAGLFVLTTGVLQLGLLIGTDFSKSSILVLDTSSIWTQLEQHIGLWLACLPTLQPISAFVVSKMLPHSKKTSINLGPPGPDITVGRSSKRLAPIRIVPGPRIGIAVSTDLEAGLVEENTKSIKSEEREMGRLNQGHSRDISSSSIIKTTEIDVTSSQGRWHPSKTWVST